MHEPTNASGFIRPLQHPLVAALLLGLGATPLAQAATQISVTTKDDAGWAGSCTLRQAIGAMNNSGSTVGTSCVASPASGTDTIVFDTTTFPLNGANTITLADATNNALTITDTNLTIDATANGNVTVQEPFNASNQYGIFSDTAPSGSLSIKHLTISNGYAGSGGGGISTEHANLSIAYSTLSGNSTTGWGGGIYSHYGNVTLTNSTLTGNSAGFGGGINSRYGSVTLTNSTLTGNSAYNDGGGISSHSGITLTNSTLAGNSAKNSGGGILADGAVTMTNSTLTGNSAASGGGLLSSSTVTLTNTTISKNTATNYGGGVSAYNTYGITANNSIIAGNTQCCSGDVKPKVASGTNNVVGIDPQLGGLADNGGPTWTMLPLAGSPAIDAGANTTCSAAPVSGLDQRGIARPQPAGGSCDIGAAEALRYVLTVDVTGNGSVSAANTPLSGAIQNCRTTGCVATYPESAPIVLTALPDPGYRLISWTGSDASCVVSLSDATQVTVKMDQAHTCKAAFAPNLISGTIATLQGGGKLGLSINGGATPVETINVNASSTNTAPVPFAFVTPVATGAAWSVGMSTPPTNLSQTCTTAGGTMSAADVTNAAINCTTNQFTVGGTINGLSGSGLKLLINGGGAITPAKGATGFDFPPMLDGTAWTLTIDNTSAIANVSQTCTVASGGSGTLAGADVSSVVIDCTTDSYTVGGTIAGLTSTGLMLHNGADNLSPAANAATFTFGTSVSSGGSYDISVTQQPHGVVCTVANASGTVTSAPITNAAVTCVAAQSVLSLTVDDAHAYARYGMTLDYTVTLSFSGNDTASAIGVSVATPGTGLDLAHAAWQCMDGDSVATCTASGTGALNDTAALPSGHAPLHWLVSVPVLANTNDAAVELDATAAGVVAASDRDTLVVYREGFDLANADGTQARVTGTDAHEVFVLPPANGNAVEAIKRLRDGTDEIRVDRIALGANQFVRLLRRDASGIEHAGEWAKVSADAVLVLGSVEAAGQRLILLEGAQQSMVLAVGTN